MKKLKKKISHKQLTYQIFAQDDYLNLRKELSSRHVAISGMGFIIDYRFIFVVRPNKNDVFSNEFLNSYNIHFCFNCFRWSRLR